MCGRFAITVEREAILAEFGIPAPDGYRPRYNVAPTQPVLAIVSGPGGWVGTELIWGLVPNWARAGKGGPLRINARAETIVARPSFRESFLERRCLVPADGFFEWQGEGRKRRPLLIKRKDGRVFAFAGLWDRWTGADGATLSSCTIVTTTPNELVRPIHDRMPVILDRQGQESWLRGNTRVEELKALLQPFRSDLLEAVPVSKLVNSARNDEPACVQPVSADAFTTELELPGFL